MFRMLTSDYGVFSLIPWVYHFRKIEKCINVFARKQKQTKKKGQKQKLKEI